MQQSIVENGDGWVGSVDWRGDDKGVRDLALRKARAYAMPLKLWDCMAGIHIWPSDCLAVDRKRRSRRSDWLASRTYSFGQRDFWPASFRMARDPIKWQPLLLGRGFRDS